LGWLTLVLLAGCDPIGAYDYWGEGDGASVGAILVEPSSIDFGEHDVVGIDTFVSRTFTVSNLSSRETYIHGHDLVVGDGEFEVIATSSELLSGHEAMTYEIVFRPLGDGDFAGDITINDGGPQGEPQVHVQGRALAPRLAMSAIDPIATTAGCTQTVQVDVSNEGRQPLELAPGGGASDLGWSSLEPLVLEPGAGATLGIVHDPASGTTPGAATRTLTLQTNDPADDAMAGERTVPIEVTVGSQTRFAKRTRFESALQMSLLLVADTRDEMAPYLEELAEHASSLVSSIAAEDGDVHLAVVTGHDDSGCPGTAVPFINTRANPEGAAYLVADGLGIAGKDEWASHLLSYTRNTLGQVGAGGCLADFVRPHTMLHVVILAGGSEGSLTNARIMGEDITGALDGTPTQLSVMVPLGDCDDITLDDRFLDAAYNGYAWDLCAQDWGPMAEDVVPDTGWVRFPVADGEPLPMLGTIEVRGPSGDLLEEGADWTYDSVDPAVLVSASVDIPSGEDVAISYLPESACTAID
jgi:hypothetical protein